MTASRTKPRMREISVMLLTVARALRRFMRGRAFDEASEGQGAPEPGRGAL